MTFTHGVAAKLINCYLKPRFVCAGYSDHPNVTALHPPIDKLLLEELAAQDFGRERVRWKEYSKHGWSRLNSDDYEAIVTLSRKIYLVNRFG